MVAWAFSVTPGQYRLAATWPERTYAATNSPFTVYDGPGRLATVRVNEKLRPSDFTDLGVGWEDLGTYRATGDTLVVLLSDNADGFVVADAIRYERVEVVARQVFYNNSLYDGNRSDADSGDDGAIAPDKTALLPGETAGFRNYTSFSQGINGVIVDVTGLADIASISADDFLLKVGNSNDPSTWPHAPPPRNVAVRTGAGVGGSDRITLTWEDNAIQDTWLQVTLLANATTGLADADIFYFGNAVGETGHSTADAKVNSIDMLGVRNNQRSFINPAPITFRYDFNRDARVDMVDYLIVRNGQASFLDALKRITPQSSGTSEGKVLLAPNSKWETYSRSMAIQEIAEEAAEIRTTLAGQCAVDRALDQWGWSRESLPARLDWILDPDRA